MESVAIACTGMLILIQSGTRLFFSNTLTALPGMQFDGRSAAPAQPDWCCRTARRRKSKARPAHHYVVATVWLWWCLVSYLCLLVPCCLRLLSRFSVRLVRARAFASFGANCICCSTGCSRTSQQHTAGLATGKIMGLDTGGKTALLMM